MRPLRKLLPFGPAGIEVMPQIVEPGAQPSSLTVILHAGAVMAALTGGPPS